MAQETIGFIGVGLMGHGIAQVFALAGHEVKITDTVVKNLDTVASRIAANLRDLGEDESAVERVQPSATRYSTSSRTPRINRYGRRSAART